MSHYYVDQQCKIKCVIRSYLLACYTDAGASLCNMVFIYKILAHIISPVSMLFNNSVSEGIFPECFKMAKIIPIFKSCDSNSTVNYRPISMLPFLSKIFEKLMCARLDS